MAQDMFVPITGADGPAEGLSFNVTRYARGVREGRVREAQGNSDFTMFTDIVDRGVALGYLDRSFIRTNFETLAYREDTMELRGAGGLSGRKEFRLNAAALLDRVAPGAEYVPGTITDEYFSAFTDKYGRSYEVQWETWLSDKRRLNLLGNLPTVWGQSARYTQQTIFTSLYANNTTFFTAGRGNLKTGAGGALSADNVGIAMAAVRKQRDPSGNVAPYAGKFWLVVPPDLEFKARQIVESPLVVYGGSAAIPNNNPMQNAAEVVVDDFLPAVDATHGTTAWYLFCDPRIRPAFRYGFLSGYEEPQIWMRDDTVKLMRGVAGGDDTFEGSYLNDTLGFKIRMTFGADELDYRGAYMSTGEAAGT